MFRGLFLFLLLVTPLGAGRWVVPTRSCLAGTRQIVLAPVDDGFTLKTSDDGGKTWAQRSSRSITGHERIESQFVAAQGRRVYLTWIDLDAPRSPGDAVAKPIYLAISEDGGASWSAPRDVTRGLPRACPCCVPQIALSGDAVYIAYRTSIENVKEVAVLVSHDRGRTFRFRPVSRDRWKFMGCPAIPPKLVAAGRRVSVTWTREKTILSAGSRDGGRSFSRPRVVPGQKP